MLYKAIEISHWFLNHVRELTSEEDEEFLTNLKLQKMLYYAQGASLALKDRPLFDDEIVHWQHGPVVKAVYWGYASNGGKPIIYDEDYTDTIDPETDALLQDVYATFGCYSAWGLRNMTHQEAPWKDTVMHEVISQESIRKYFLENYVE